MKILIVFMDGKGMEIDCSFGYAANDRGVTWKTRESETFVPWAAIRTVTKTFK